MSLPQFATSVVVTVPPVMAVSMRVRSAPNAPVPTQVVLAGNPTQSSVTLSVTGPTSTPTEATLWAQTAVSPYGYTQDVPLLPMRLSGGQRSITQPLALNLSYYNFLFARLDIIDGSLQTAASMSMVV